MFGNRRNTECQSVREKLSLYLDSRLEGVERDRLKYHTERCNDCRAEMESVAATRELLHRMPVAPVPRSFRLAEVPVRRSWFPFEIPTLSLESSLRMAGAAALVLLVVMLSLDFSGALTQNATDPEGVVGNSPEPTDAVTAVSPAPSATPTPDPSNGEVGGIPEALPPDPSGDKSTGIAVSADPQMQEGPTGNSIPDTFEAVDHNGESGVSSPAPRSLTPGWLLPLEIAAGAVLLITAGLLIGRKQHIVR